ncbi:MAG: hypothetical protein EHM60_02695 [Lysobacterales bacterium]|jgi:uncharacterized membrane protein|nr:MAG: hypothetical protein EHM60_02695 [Xanthomonadales bacterium]
MLIESELLGTGMRIVTGTAAAAVVVHAARTAPWRFWLSDGERQRVWLFSLLLLVGLWSMNAGITPGLSLRFLLVSALTLMHGWQLAVIGGSIALALLGLTGQAEWPSFGADVICTVIVPALVTARLHEVVHERLPHNYFVYFFVTVFVGSAIAYNVAGLSRLVILAFGGAFETGRVGAEYFAVLPFMSFGEAVANGMVMAMSVVYKPRWVMSFDDAAYLGKRG